MVSLNTEGLYLDGDDYKLQKIAGTTGAVDEPDCCSEGMCGTDECGCKSKPALIKGIRDSVANAINPVER